MTRSVGGPSPDATAACSGPEDVPAVDAPLYDALARLPFKHRAAVVLRYYLGLTELEIAAHLDCPPGSGGPWIRRGLDRLATELRLPPEEPMTSHETAIAGRLRAAADRIDVDSDASRVTESGPSTDVGQPPFRRRRVLAGLAIAASVAAAVIAVRSVPDDGTVRTGPPDVTAPAPGGGPTEPSYAAHVASPPDWFGEPRGGDSDGGHRPVDG